MGILSQLFVDVGTDLSKLDTGLNRAKAQITDFSAKANSLLGSIGLGLSVAGVGKFLLDAAEKGSNLGETMSKVKEVFKDSTSAVNAMADDMATKFGAVKGVTLDAAANLGLVAQGAGMSAKEAADMSVKLTRLADDASSFYNVDLNVALEKIRSGLVGEAEPLRAFGVLLSEDAVKAKAAAMGIQSVHGELSEQAKVAARVQLITEGLNKATGDHERTLGSYANQIRMVKGELENWTAAFGAPIAGGLAMVMQKARTEGMAATLQRSIFGMAGFDVWQKQADKNAGVVTGLQKPAPVEPPIFAQLRAQLFPPQKQGEIYNAPGMAGMNFMNALNMGGLGQQFNRVAMRDDLTSQINAQKKSMNAWGGGHVMDSESFMRQAQEKILRPEDDTAKKQLAELIKAREALDKIAGKQEGKATVGKMVLKGRES